MIILSNCYEVLLAHLKRDLLETSREDPLGLKWIVLPKTAMKEYVRWELVRQFGSLTGVRFCFLSELLAMGDCAVPPPKLQLSLEIETTIFSLFAEGKEFSPLKEYFTEGIKGEREARRLIGLSDSLASLYLQKVQESERGEVFYEEKWQQNLFERVAFAEKKKEKKHVELFLFGFSHIPKIYWEILEKQGAHLYHLSVCREFWSDLITDRQRVKYKEQSTCGEEIDTYLQESNALLRNFGALPRRFAKEVEERELLTHEEYFSFEETTLLERVQRDLLDMGLSHASAFSDDSIQLHVASTALREVEVVRLLIIDAMRNEPDLQPSDFLVYVTDLKRYAPLISFVFEKESPKIPYVVTGKTTENSCIEGLCFLLALAEKPWTIEDVEELLGYSAILRRFQIEQEDREELLLWFRKAGARAGFEQREEGTWQTAIDRLLLGLALEEEEDPKAVGDVSYTQADLLGRFVLLLTSLWRDLQPVREKEKREFSEWVAYFRSIVLEYFAVGEEKQTTLEQISRLQEFAPVSKGEFSFLSMQRVLEQLLQNSRGEGASAFLSNVRFLPLEIGSVIPGKRAFVLGCDEESLPKQLTQEPFVKSTTLQREEERAVFLELLVSAREKIAFLYSRLTDDGEMRCDSPFIYDLFSYLDPLFADGARNALSVFHPNHSFAREYFSPSFPVRGTQEEYRLAEQRERERKQTSFFPSQIVAGEKREMIEVSLDQLLRFARHPFRFYLRESLGIDLRKDPMQEYLDREFSLPGYARNELRREGFEMSWKDLIDDAMRGGKLPMGGMKKGVMSRMREDLDEWKESFRRCEIFPEELFCVSISEEHRGKDSISPVILSLPDGRSAKITGVVPEISPKGLILPGKASVEEWIAHWPLVLLYAHIALEKNLSSSLLFFPEGKECSLRSDHEVQKWLGEYVLFYERALNRPSPFSPAWGKFFLEGKREEFCKAVRSIGSSSIGFEDRDLKWLKQRGVFADPDALFDNWEKEIQEMFASPYCFWKEGE